MSWEKHKKVRTFSVSLEKEVKSIDKDRNKIVVSMS